jgi:hypothetical protein
VPLPLLRRAALLGCALLALTAAGAGAVAVVEYKDIVLTADGGFQPRQLPRKQFVPIEFQGFVGIGSRSGGRPATLTTAVVDFDRDGRLSAGGLPTCPPERVAAATTAEARSLCRGAIVGGGKVEALIYFGDSVYPTSSPLTIFNGPPSEGHPTMVIHAQTTTPATQTYAILVPIERHAGIFRYRATLNLPPIAGGLGVITRFKVEIGRRFKVDGKPRSYVSAHCSDGVLQTKGRFTFADGTVVDGAVEKFCRVK